MNEFSNLRQEMITVAKYLYRFDMLAHCSLEMVAIESMRIWRFMKSLRGDLTRFMDIEKGGPIWYVDVVQHAICQESWEELEKRFSSSLGEQRDNSGCYSC